MDNPQEEKQNSISNNRNLLKPLGIVLGVIVIVAIVIAAIILLSDDSDDDNKVDLKYESTIVNSISPVSNVEVEYSFEYPQDWEIVGIGFESPYTKGAERKTVAYVTVLNKENSQYIIDKFDDPAEEDYEQKDLSGKTILIRGYDSKSSKQLEGETVEEVIWIKEAYWMPDILDQELIRFTCFGSEDDKDAIDDSCDKFIKTLELNPLSEPDDIPASYPESFPEDGE